MGEIHSLRECSKVISREDGYVCFVEIVLLMSDAVTGGLTCSSLWELLHSEADSLFYAAPQYHQMNLTEHVLDIPLLPCSPKSNPAPVGSAYKENSRCSGGGPGRVLIIVAQRNSTGAASRDLTTTGRDAFTLLRISQPHLTMKQRISTHLWYW
ncbi:hypothetical protein FKM82_012880 [Ascaphus truei]